MRLRDALIQQSPSLELQRSAAAEIARLDAIESAALRVLAAFKSLGVAQQTGPMLMARGNCESAMLALQEAVSAGKEGGAS
jgi:hypothetical protein